MYKFEAIWDSAAYIRKSKSHLPGLYYLILWKAYPKEQNIGEPALMVQYLRNLISIFPHNYPEKPIAMSFLINTASSMTKPTAKLLAIKQN